ncbi:CmpA/NrtA family ABC transporter substrate-binding protein [Methylobacterium sp. JK268]
MRLQIGYVPLTDAACLIAMVEGGFAAREGLSVDLVPEPSWATLRDKLALGLLDGAHCLAPLALASHLGLSGPPASLIAPSALGRHGNAVTLSLSLWEAMAPASETLADVARALAAVARARAAEERPLTLATVHPFSSHTYQLRRLLARGGGDLAQVRVVVVPPPRTVESLRRGLIDGFCVGAPWNSVAVAAGVGRIAALGADLAPDAPEKVLALPAESEERVPPLLRALRGAARWCGAPAHHPDLARMLGDPRYLGVPPDLILRALDDRRDGGAVSDTPTFGEDTLAFGMDAVDWILAEMAASGQFTPTPAARAQAAALVRPDLLAARD